MKDGDMIPLSEDEVGDRLDRALRGKTFEHVDELSQASLVDWFHRVQGQEPRYYPRALRIIGVEWCEGQYRGSVRA